MDGVLADSLARRRFSMALLGGFAGLALVLVAAGIYGVISYTAIQRTQEVGIRAALGARPSQIFRLVIGQALRLTLIGMVVGIAGALLLTRFISSTLYGVRPTDPATFSFVLLAIGAVAFIASYIPARRATKVDPMVALRHE